MQPGMSFADAAWEQSEEVTDTWVLHFHQPDVLRAIRIFLFEPPKPEDPVALDILERGAFNISFQMM